MRLLRVIRLIPASTLWLAAVASLLAGFANVALLGLINKRLTTTADVTAVFALQFGLAALGVIMLDYGAKWLLLRLTARTGHMLRMQLIDKILDIRYASLEQIGAPRLLAALTDDVRRVTTATNQIPNLAVGSAILIGCVLYMAWLSLPTFLLAVGLSVPVIWGQSKVRRRARAKQLLTLDVRNRLFRHYRVLTEGAKELRMHRKRRDVFVDEHLLQTAEEFESLAVETRSLYYLGTSWSQAVYFFFIFVLFALATLLNLGSEILVSYAIVALYARTSIIGITNLLPILNEATIALEQLEQIGMRIEREPPSDEEMEPLPHRTPFCLTLHDLCYSYSGEQREFPFQLGPLDLDLHGSELVFLIGGNGSGKTTLAKLLLGLYLPEQGTISWNGQPITESTLTTYRELFSVVFSDFYLFDELFEFYNEHIDADAAEMLQKLHLEHKVHVEDGRFSTVDLSTGQRQRLALVAAYLTDRPIYLFDEWAAGQDPEFKQIFYCRLLPELKRRGKLIIVISHDDHYYHLADRVIKLDSGQIEYDRIVRTEEEELL